MTFLLEASKKKTMVPILWCHFAMVLNHIECIAKINISGYFVSQKSMRLPGIKSTPSFIVLPMKT